MRSDRATIETYRLSADGPFPNNPTLPLLVYRSVIEAGTGAADEWEKAFQANGWGGCWRNGVFAFHHFHSNAHEALGIAAGSAKIQFGGPAGPIIGVASGDLAVLPAGTAHKRIEGTSDLLVVGAYPQGQTDYDLRRGEAGEVVLVRERIAAVPLPEADPLFGPDGPLLQHWR